MSHGTIPLGSVQQMVIILLPGCLIGHRIAYAEDLAVGVLGSSFSFTIENTRLVEIVSGKSVNLLPQSWPV